MILDALQLDPAELERRTGWSIKPEGACKDDRCVPLPASENAPVDMPALAERLQMPLIHDAASGLWCLGPEAGGRAPRAFKPPSSSCRTWTDKNSG